MAVRSLRLEQVSKEYNLVDGRFLHILDRIDHVFLSHTTVAIMGASGTGKSTLLHILAGITQPTTGSIFFNDRAYADWNTHEWQKFYTHHIGVLFQQPYLIQEFTVLENIMIKGMVAGLPRRQLQQDAYQLLELAQLSDKALCMPAQLSGGQQQRVALMRALIIRPDFLLADEPTGNLDPDTGMCMLKIMLSCQRQWGMGIIVSTHDQYVADCMQQRYCIINGALRSVDAL